jgi:hypothetical protein
MITTNDTSATNGIAPRGIEEAWQTKDRVPWLLVIMGVARLLSKYLICRKAELEIGASFERLFGRLEVRGILRTTLPARRGCREC